MKGKIFAKGFYNWTFLLVVVVGLVLVNIISSLVSKRFDMTRDGRYSLKPTTIQFLEKSENFKSRLNIKIYLEGKLPAELAFFRNAIEDKLIEFKQYAGDQIEYQFIDPNVGTKEEQYDLHQTLFANGKGIIPMDIMYEKGGEHTQMLLWPGAVIEYGGATVNVIQLLPGSRSGQPYRLEQMGEIIQNSMNNLEYMLVSSLRRAIQESKPRIAFLQGHGELSFAQTQRARALLSPYYSITDITLNDSLAALEGVQGLIIARPRTMFSEKDLYIIDQFVMQGGRLMCFLDKLYLNEDTLNATGQTHTTRYDIGLDKMLFDYGLKINDNYVIDANCAIKQLPYAKQSAIPWFFHVKATPTSHAIARNVEPVDLEYVSEIQFIDNNPNVVLSPVLTSGTNSTVTGLAPLVNLSFPLNFGKNPELVPNPESESNKKCIAGLAEGTFNSYFKNRIVDEFAKNPAVKYKEAGEKEAKVFVIGNGRLFENKYDSMPARVGNGFMYRPRQFNDLQFDEGMVNMGIPHYFGNQEFVQNLVDYMMGDNSVIDLRSRQIDINEINKDEVKTSGQFYMLLNTILPVVIVILLALVITYLRKRKYAKN